MHAATKDRGDARIPRTAAWTRKTTFRRGTRQRTCDFCAWVDKKFERRGAGGQQRLSQRRSSTPVRPLWPRKIRKHVCVESANEIGAAALLRSTEFCRVYDPHTPVVAEFTQALRDEAKRRPEGIASPK